MNETMLHTPEGVRDIINEECEKKMVLSALLTKWIHSYGYHSIQTPTFEFFDIFANEVGTISSRELYKFFDREGNTLCLRPDFTPSIARAAAKYYSGNDKTIRLCYEGNVFINNHSYQGRLKETTQLGAELIGENSVDADGEILSLVVQLFLASGLTEFQISVGHADILQGLIEAAGFSSEDSLQIRNLISNKNFFGVDEFLDQKELPSKLKKLFSLLSKMYDTPMQWKELEDMAVDFPKINNALVYLDRLYELLSMYDVERYITFEPGLFSEYQYYTGIIFSGYTFGSGEPIVKGGRYDHLLSYFGKNEAAIGFAFTLDKLLTALERQNISVPLEQNHEVYLYSEKRKKEAVRIAMQERKNGKTVELVLAPQDAKAVSELRMQYHQNSITEIL